MNSLSTIDHSFYTRTFSTHYFLQILLSNIILHNTFLLDHYTLNHYRQLRTIAFTQSFKCGFDNLFKNNCLILVYIFNYCVLFKCQKYLHTMKIICKCSKTRNSIFQIAVILLRKTHSPSSIKDLPYAKYFAYQSLRKTFAKNSEENILFAIWSVQFVAS